jgi:prevent-host-death family protein
VGLVFGTIRVARPNLTLVYPSGLSWFVAKSVEIEEAKTRFPKLLARVLRGEEIVIAKAGQPMARLIPERGSARAPRKPGIDKGKLRIAADFDRLSEPDLQAWY